MERGGESFVSEAVLGESSLGGVLDGIAERLSNLFAGKLLSASDFKRTPSTHLFLAHSTMCQFKSSIQASLCRHGAKKDT